MEEIKSDPKKPTESREEMRQRAEQCGRQVFDVLAAHRCRIVAYLLPMEPVGDGTKAIVQASYGIVPE